MGSAGSESETCHASAVAIAGQGVLITGPSGSGKSGLALELIALGAVLIADDRVGIERRDGHPWLCAPPRLAGVIEARHVGLLTMPFCRAAPLALLVDMAVAETERLPETRVADVLGTAIPVQRRVDAPAFAASILALAKGGRWQG